MKFITLGEVPKLNETSDKTMAHVHKVTFFLPVLKVVPYILPLEEGSLF